MKAPYNISSPTSAIAIAALQARNLEIMRQNREKILRQRKRLLEELPRIPGVGQFRGGTDSNFLLVEILDRPRQQGGQPDNVTALTVYETLAGQRGVVVRFRGKEYGCQGCLRITVGTEKEVDRFLAELKSVLGQIYSASSQASQVNGMQESEQERQRETEASSVIS